MPPDPAGACFPIPEFPMAQDAPIELRAEDIQRRGYGVEALRKPRQCHGYRPRRAAIAKLIEQLGLPG
jgi:hypothetical protein